MNNYDIVKLLVDNGADVNKYYRNLPALTYAPSYPSICGHTEITDLLFNHDKPLMNAISKNDVNLVRQLLQTPDININLYYSDPTDIYENSPLMYAIRKDHYDIVKVLFIQYW